jgi:hypothetical protein
MMYTKHTIKQLHLLIMVVTMIQNTGVFGQNPNRLIRIESKAIVKEKTPDPIVSELKVVNALKNPSVKRKFQKLGRKVIINHYPASIDVSKKRIKKSLKNVSKEKDSYKQYLIYVGVIDRLKNRKLLSESLSSSNIEGVTPENVSSINKQLDNILIKREASKQLAIQDRYKKGMELLKEEPINKSTYRSAYYHFEAVKKLHPHYKQVDSMQAIAKARGTTHIRFISILAGDTNKHSRAAVNKIKKSIGIYFERYDNSNPFFRVGWSTSKPANVTVKLILTGKVSKQTHTPKTYNDTKTIKDKNGKVIEIKSTQTVYEKSSASFVNGLAFIRDSSGKLIEEKKLYGSHNWSKKWMKYTGQKQAVKNSRKYLIGSKEASFKKDEDMLSLAAEEFSYRALNTLFSRLKNIAK